MGNWDEIDSDDNGNPGTPSDERTHNTTNQILTIDPEGAVGSFDVIHDDAGNLRILPDRTDPTNKADKYVYDYRNRLIEIWHTTDYDENDPENTDWGQNPIVKYYYDGLNRRVKTDLDTDTQILYLYDMTVGKLSKNENGTRTAKGRKTTHGRLAANTSTAAPTSTSH